MTTSLPDITSHQPTDHLHADRRRARTAGVLFLVAAAASITGGTLIQSVLDRPDAHAVLLDERAMVIAGIWLEVVNALAVVGIVAALWAPLSRRHPGVTAGYLGVRVLEAAACAAAALIPVALIAIAERGSSATEPIAMFGALRAALLSDAVPVLFGVGAAILYLLLYRTRLVPRYLALWGLVGAAGIVANVMISVPEWQPVLVLPMITNEVYLGVYLLVRGFRRLNSGS